MTAFLILAVETRDQRKAPIVERKIDFSASIAIRFERGLAKGVIALDPAEDNRVSELLFTSVEALADGSDTPAKITADLSALPGNVNAWFAPLNGDAAVIADAERLDRISPHLGELNALDITSVQAKIAGAELTGSGALTFDNTDLVTYGGMPAPTGKVDLKLVGGNALLDKLVMMGLLTEDDANGARMMVSMFANSVAEDELTSTLEFKDKGFFANGQQLQ